MLESPELAFAKAIKLVGTRTGLAKKLGIQPWAVHKWNPKRIPEDRCLEIEKIVEGQVTAEQLRPDVNWEYVRKQALAKTA